MFNRTRMPAGRVALFGDVLFSLLIFPFAFGYQDNAVSILRDPIQAFRVFMPGLNIWGYGLFAALALAHLCRAFRQRAQSRALFIAHLAFAAVFAACIGLLAAAGGSEGGTLAICLAFWGCLIVDRVIAIARRRRPLSIIGNVIVLLLLFLCIAVSFFGYGVLFLQIAAPLTAVVSILFIIFSRIRVDVLNEIIRKTYAAEIIGGLLLLMVTFSYVLKFTDEAFESFWDGLWYCFAVVTTIGFGDITPTGAIGRVITAILGVYGIVVVALITSIIVNFYGEMKRGAPAGTDAGESGAERQANRAGE